MNLHLNAWLLLFDLVVLVDVRLFAVISGEFETFINELDTAVEFKSDDVNLELINDCCCLIDSIASNKLLALVFIFDKLFVCVLFVDELFTEDTWLETTTFAEQICDKNSSSLP